MVSGLLKDGAVKNMSAEFRRKDGSFWPGMMTAGYIFQGGRRHILTSTKDLTLVRRTEEALRRSEKLKAVGQLSGGIAHDFNNLLAIIMGNLEILKRVTGDDESLGKWIDTAIQGTKRGADLTQSLLQFSQKDARETITVSINELIRDINSLLRNPSAIAVDLKFDLAENLWPTVINPGDFSDTLINLTINAHDAMPEGGEVLIKTSNVSLHADHIFMSQHVAPGDYVCLEIFDAGSGMEPDVVDQVFEPFFSTKERGKGTGLGLSMVYGFVNRSGGEISVHSEPGHGSVFRIYLPRAEGNMMDDTPGKESDRNAFCGSETILVVDDEEHLLEVAEEHLKSLGYRTLSAVSAEQALRFLDDGANIDLLLSDVVMQGGINGFELAKRALDMNPALKVLLTSGFTSQEALARSGVDFSDETTKLLFSDLLPKPYSREKLARGIRRELDKETGH